MPGEIDTGGPRVLLHCVERPDCPIPRSSTIVTFSSSSSSSLSAACYRSFAIRQETCLDEAHRTSNSTLQRSSSGETRTISGNDERNEFFPDERATPVSSTSSNDLGQTFAPRERRGRKRSISELLRRHRPRRRYSIVDDSGERKEAVSSTDDHHHVPKMCEIARDDVVEACPVDDTRQRTSAIRSEKEEPCSLGTSTCNLTRVKRDNHTEILVRESSAVAIMRLFDDCGVERECHRSIYPSKVKSSAAISSQRSRHHHEVIDDDDDEEFGDPCPLRNDDDDDDDDTIDCRVNCECNCDDSREFKNFDGTRNERRKRPKNIRHKCRTYLQLALLLFLVAFGHNSLFKMRCAGFGGTSGIGAGLGVVTIGTIVRTVGALPVLDLDAGVRAERSANLSHITGASRKIQMYIKNRHLQILPDGTVNGSNDDTSEYTIFQRTSVSRGQLRIQGVATCLYLCMDSCGLLYGSREYTDDCVFNETLEQHNYNTYSSVRWSTAKKTLYLGLNRRGQPRRVQAKGHNLGRLSAYARVLTQVAATERVEALHSRMLGAQHNLRHHHNSHHHRNMQQQAVCPNLPPQEKDGRDKFRCRKRKKRKKRKRRCNDGEKPGPHCESVEDPSSHHRINAETSGEGPPQSKRSCEGAASEELCRKQALDAPAKKRKSRIETTKKNSGTRENQPQRSSSKKEVKTRKNVAGKKLNYGGGSVNAEEDSPRRVNGTSAKRKRPASRQRMALAKKKNNAGRVTRTTLPTNPTVVAMTLPSSWFPGASTTPSPRNSVTGKASSIDESKSSRSGKALVKTVQLPTESSLLDVSTENLDDHSSTFGSLSGIVEDLSSETSEEAKSDESTQEDDPTTSSSSEYSTLMTTMDTTPPERTEDYTRATTTESILGSIEVSGGRDEKHNEDSRLAAEHPSKLSREPRLERLAM